MNYQALYRKYRPQVFDDVKGQDVIVRTLRNQIRTGRIGHAYLFCGSRGTGKTTAAKIFAKAINCENPQDGNPCLSCGSCRAIQDGASMNVIEMDAASRNSVDDFRQIIDEISYPPTAGRYKVYIIDEAHMVTGSAFNAFLKTLEEPPEYAVFILATTDPQKLPATILSRCQRYDFRRIPAQIIEERMREVLISEGVEAEDEAISYIARRAEGGMRDALSIMDQCISFYIGEKLTYEHVLDVLGTSDRSVYREMLRCAINGNASHILKVFDSLLLAGRDVRQVLSDFTWYIRDVLLFKASGGSSESLGLTKEDARELLAAGDLADEDTLMYDIEVLSELSSAMRNSSNRRVLAEIGLIRLCRPQTAKSERSGQAARLTSLEQGLEKTDEELDRLKAMLAEGTIQVSAGRGGPGESRDTGPDPAGGRLPEKQKAPKVVVPELFSRIKGQWRNTMTLLHDPGLGSILANKAEPWYNSDDPETLYVVFEDSGFWIRSYRDNRDVLKELQDILEKKYNVRPSVRFTARAELEGKAGAVKVEGDPGDHIEGIDFTVETEQDGV